MIGAGNPQVMAVEWFIDNAHLAMLREAVHQRR
jgi:hypothetical protein